MAGGPAHLRPVTELTTRLCYVNFDGSEALQHSRELGLQQSLSTDFVKQYCTPVYEGIEVILKIYLLQKEIDFFLFLWFMQ